MAIPFISRVVWLRFFPFFLFSTNFLVNCELTNELLLGFLFGVTLVQLSGAILGSIDWFIEILSFYSTHTSLFTLRLLLALVIVRIIV